MTTHTRAFATIIIVAVAFLAGSASAADVADAKIRWEKVTLIEDLNEGIDVADVNRDGKLDVIAGASWFEGPKWKRHRLREVGVANEEFATNNGDHAIDLNDDGWVDVIAASWFSDKIHWYENPGKEGLADGRLWKQRLVAKGQNCCEGTLLADLDGDKVPELIISSWSPEKHKTVVKISPGTGWELPTFQVVDLGSPGTGHGAGVGDINGDGRTDILACKGWFEQPASDWTATKWKFHNSFDYAHISLPCLVVDVNRNGRNDLIIGQAHNFGLRWLEQGSATDGTITWTEHLIDESYSQMHYQTWADLDGDDHEELITGKRWRGHKGGDPGAAEPVCLFRYVWNAKTKSFERDTISYDDGIGCGMQIRTVDIDGDKKIDIAVAGKTGTHILFNRGPAEKSD